MPASPARPSGHRQSVRPRLPAGSNSPVVDKQVAGTNAVPTHVVLALVAVGLVAGLPRLRLAQQAPYSMWMAPFSQSGVDRVKHTISLGSGVSAASIARAVPTSLLSILLLYNSFRAGLQVTGGFDPNFTVNAWGGPGYLGALLAHYLDAAYLFYVEALVLNWILIKPTR
jgi:hypothetical protein